MTDTSTTEWSSRARDLLGEVFGFHGFRGDQEAVIDHVIAGGDALVVMPTGGGKSLCYQLPALVRPGVAIVISPLVALMQDQVDALKQAGVAAACLHAGLNRMDADRIEAAAVTGDLDLLYVAPERLVRPHFLSMVERAAPSLFAIDEAHCVSQWGHDFRPEYRELAVLSERFPGVPRLGLTATADEPTRREIIEQLQLDQARSFVGGFDRPNICYRVVPKKRAKRRLFDFLQTHHEGESGIVYCMSRKKTEKTARWLTDKGIEALPYHAGMAQADRDEHQRRFLKE
ncbi:MAG: RecQ family ATP-dependent DNA helicase, partial [Phycisphaeraceae bacterium]|nr:RecQ family ATP-dependent DNA helicase [Phycisphaeraceae bacterium]